MAFMGRKYFYDSSNALEWCLFVSTAVFLVPFWLQQEQTVVQWSFGAVAIFMGFLGLILFVRKLDVFGIYVIMFLETLATVVKVLAVFSLLIVGFALSFHVLLNETYYFGNMGRSLMKTYIMMTGEYEYGAYFPEGLSFSIMPYLGEAVGEGADGCWTVAKLVRMIFGSS